MKSIPADMRALDALLEKFRRFASNTNEPVYIAMFHTAISDMEKHKAEIMERKAGNGMSTPTPENND